MPAHLDKPGYNRRPDESKRGTMEWKVEFQEPGSGPEYLRYSTIIVHSPCAVCPVQI